MHGEWWGWRVLPLPKSSTLHGGQCEGDNAKLSAAGALLVVVCFMYTLAAGAHQDMLCK